MTDPAPPAAGPSPPPAALPTAAPHPIDEASAARTQQAATDNRLEHEKTVKAILELAI